MKIWTKPFSGLGNPSEPSHMFDTNTARFKFGEKAFINRKGYAQHRMDRKMPEAFVGYVLSIKGGKENITGLIASETTCHCWDKAKGANAYRAEALTALDALITKEV